ncbi:replication initiator protein A [Psychrobacillus sp. NPDC096623]|uniref:replication initiator protein A n=1 Tax=Psychrobacillus sp. NPDC096623 TaxID=3364492 RepID=UPI003822D6B9
MNNKFNISDQVAERFYRLPKVFFTNDLYKKLSNDAKIAYALLQDRLELSIKNDWFDEEGSIYFLFGNEQLGEILNCSKPTVIKIKKELQKCDLLEERRMGLSKSNRLFLLKPVADLEDIQAFKMEQKSFSDLEPQQKLNILTSRSKNSLLQEVKNFNTNDTDFSDTDFNDTEVSIHHRITSLDIPTMLKEVLIDNQERLMDDMIKVKDIELHYKAHAGILTDYQYASALQYSLEKTKGKIKNISARLTKAVEDKQKWIREQQASQRLTKEEMVPEWFQERNQSRDEKSQGTEELSEEMKIKRDQLLKELRG